MNPNPLKRVVIKEELVALTGHHISALILNQFIYWSERTKDTDKYIEEEKTRDPDLDIEPLYGWVYKKADELNEELMLDLSATTIRRYITKLTESSLLRERHNPKQKYDRTLQYRPDILEVQRQLHDLGYALEGYPLYGSPRANLQNEDCNQHNEDSKLQNAVLSLQNEDSNSQNVGAITEITSETTSETKHTKSACEKKFGFEFASSPESFVEPPRTDVITKEAQIVSIDQSSAAPIAATQIYKPTAEEESFYFNRLFIADKGTYASRSSDPWMDGVNPKRCFRQWLLNRRQNQQRNGDERYFSYTPTTDNIRKEIRNDAVAAAGLWEDFLEEMHHRVKNLNSRVQAGIAVKEEEWKEVSAIAPYAGLQLLPLPIAISASPVPPQDSHQRQASPASIPAILPQAEGIAAYAQYKADAPPTEEQLAEYKQRFSAMARNFAMSKSQSPKAAPVSQLEKMRSWLKGDEPALRSEAIAWAERSKSELEIDRDESGNVIDFAEVEF